MSKASEGVYSTNERHRQALEFIENVTTNIDQVQSQVLSEILARNGETEYLKRHKLNGRTDRRSFKECLPVITYADLLPDILRIANGDTSPILSTHPISEFISSTGTSCGEPKLIPVPNMDEDLDRRVFLFDLCVPVIDQYMPGLDQGKAMFFLFVRSDTRTPGGLVVRPISTAFYKSRQFRERLCDPHNIHTSPYEAIVCCDGLQSLYSQLLCGLIHNPAVLRVGAIFPTTLLKAIRFLEQHWQELSHDIRSGTLNQLVKDSSLREAVLKILGRPNAELADFIDRECSKGSWQGIIARLWPNTKYIDTVVTGSMSQYIPTLDYYTAGLPVVSKAYGASECNIGINLNPFCKPSQVRYTFIPNMAYFEFLPLRRNPDSPEKLVDLVDVQVGEEYELVVTTYTGLYRCRVGDVLKVAGFHNASPQFEFVCREGVVLSIDAEKTEEGELQNAVSNSIKRLEAFDARLLEYTSLADISTVPGHYVLFWEIQTISGCAVPQRVFEECCLAIEESLNSVYRKYRVVDKSIGPLEIRVVGTGAFAELMNYAVSQGSAANQYKTPRCVKLTSMVNLLNSKVTGTYFSPKYPKWAP